MTLAPKVFEKKQNSLTLKLILDNLQKTVQAKEGLEKAFYVSQAFLLLDEEKKALIPDSSTVEVFLAVLSSFKNTYVYNSAGKYLEAYAKEEEKR